MTILKNTNKIIKILLKIKNLQKNFINSYQKNTLYYTIKINNKKIIQLLTNNNIITTPKTLYQTNIYNNNYITKHILQTHNTNFYTPQQQHTLIYSTIIKNKYTYNINKTKSKTSIKQQKFQNQLNFF